MTSLATQQDLEDIWRPVTTAEQPAILRLLSKASALLLQQAPHIPARIAAFAVDPATPGAIDPVVVAVVVAQIVKRYVVNPDGLSTSSETVGPYSQSKSFVDRYEGTDGSASMRGGLQVTKADLAMIKPYVTAGRIGSIRVKAGLAPVHTVFGTFEPAEVLNADPDSLPFTPAGVDVNALPPI